MTRTLGACGAAAVVLLLAACGAGDPADGAETGGDAAVAVAEDTAPAPEDVVETEGEGEAEGEASSSSGTYLDGLYADALHDGVEPAAAGRAYVEVAGERLELDDVTCTVDETPGAERFHVEAATPDGHRLYLERTIGPDVGWSFEDEVVQVALLVGDGASELYGNSLAQHERAEGGDPEWQHGSGESPLVRVVGDQATARGSLAAAPLAEESLEGEFVAAVTCP